MLNMSSSFDKLERKFSAVSAREQRLVFYALPFVICFVFILSLIEPAITKAMKTRSEIQNTKLQLSSISESLDAVQQELLLDPDIETRNQTKAVNQQITATEKRFASELSKLVPPSIMPIVLEQLFNKANKLTLIEMASIPPRNIFVADNATEARATASQPDGEKAQKKAVAPVLYQHGLRVTFEGSYFDTQAFLAEAEKLEWKIYWREVAFSVKQYPTAQIEIELFTLSTSEAYLNGK
jgi:MSHA biogenesis protein MshJ